MTRAEVDHAERFDAALGAGPMRPRDAASLIVLDRERRAIRVLMGRRHAGHAFMPAKYVFPGGRTDSGDRVVEVSAPLAPAVGVQLRRGLRSDGRAKAIALSAVREAYEEAGVLVGVRRAFRTTKADWQGFAKNGVQPSLERLRYVARAITPPGRIRRFDVRFFAIWRDELALELPDGGPSAELEQLVWVPLDEATGLDLAAIGRTVVAELQTRLRADPLLATVAPVPFYRLLHNRFRRELI